MKRITSHLKSLIWQRRQADDEPYGYRKIAKLSGASIWVVEHLMRDDLKRIPSDDLARLCVWLGCEPGDILKLEEEE